MALRTAVKMRKQTTAATAENASASGRHPGRPAALPQGGIDPGHRRVERREDHHHDQDRDEIRRRSPRPDDVTASRRRGPRPPAGAMPPNPPRSATNSASVTSHATKPTLRRHERHQDEAAAGTKQLRVERRRARMGVATKQDRHDDGPRDEECRGLRANSSVARPPPLPTEQLRGVGSPEPTPASRSSPYAVLRFSIGTMRASASSVVITSPKKIANVLSVPACSSSVQVALPSEIIATR